MILLAMKRRRVRLFTRRADLEEAARVQARSFPNIRRRPGGAVRYQKLMF